jgi:Mn2+/Fe2+ NRAMP family transporter
MQQRDKSIYYDSDGQPARRPSGPVARASVADDRGISEQRISALDQQVEELAQVLDDAQRRLEEARHRRDGLQLHQLGWPLYIVAVLGLVTIVLEYVPASLYTQIFVSADDSVRTLLTWTFTVVGAILAIVLGELLHRTRRPAEQQTSDKVFIVLTILAAAIYLYLGYRLRVAFTEVSGTTALNLSAAEEALALTSVALIGILVTVISAYYRESQEAFTMRRKVNSLQQEVNRAQARYKQVDGDLTRALKAIAGKNGVASGTETTTGSTRQS